MTNNSKPNRRILSVSTALAAVTLVILGCAGSPHTSVKHDQNPVAASTPTTDSSPTQNDSSSDTLGLSLGQTVAVTDDDGNSMEVTVNGAKWKTKACSAYADNPGPGKAYLIVEVTAKATKGDFDINPFDFNVVNAAGDEAETGIFSDCAKPDLAAKTLHSGRQAHGFVAFELKRANVEVEYSAGLSDVDASWKVTG